MRDDLEEDEKEEDDWDDALGYCLPFHYSFMLLLLVSFIHSFLPDTICPD